MNVYKSKGKRTFEIVHWPFELPPNQHWLTGPFGWHKWCSLARPSKGQCTISKILSSLIFSLFIEQNIFFPETCFGYTISEPKFTVCKRNGYTILHRKMFIFTKQKYSFSLSKAFRKGPIRLCFEPEIISYLYYKIFDGNEIQSITIFPSDLLVQGILERTHKGSTNISTKKLYIRVDTT